MLLCLPAHANHRPERCLQAGGRQGHVQGQGACPCLWLRSLTCHRSPRATPATTATRCTASCSALARVRALFRCVTAARRPPLQGRQVSLSAGNAVKRVSRFLLDIHHAPARNGLAPACSRSGGRSAPLVPKRVRMRRGWRELWRAGITEPRGKVGGESGAARLFQTCRAGCAELCARM